MHWNFKELRYQTQPEKVFKAQNGISIMQNSITILNNSATNLSDKKANILAYKVIMMHSDINSKRLIVFCIKWPFHHNSITSLNNSAINLKWQQG